MKSNNELNEFSIVSLSFQLIMVIFSAFMFVFSILNSDISGVQYFSSPIRISRIFGFDNIKTSVPINISLHDG